jgi:hypothetical protein
MAANNGLRLQHLKSSISKAASKQSPPTTCSISSLWPRSFLQGDTSMA